MFTILPPCKSAEGFGASDFFSLSRYSLFSLFRRALLPETSSGTVSLVFAASLATASPRSQSLARMFTGVGNSRALEEFWQTILLNGTEELGGLLEGVSAGIQT